MKIAIVQKLSFTLGMGSEALLLLFISETFYNTFQQRWSDTIRDEL